VQHVQSISYSMFAVTITEFRENLNILVKSHVGENLPRYSIVQCTNDCILAQERLMTESNLNIQILSYHITH